ncbi:hypothetical protein [Streptomyces sp. SA15]|uniref:hypothetical protein n=1 Tax=Streptomyces sp. SA15 TaxID=934019 RepID=UPI0015CDCA92|nr:hypothetical protein [Streptomyces sp. SA15]
MHWPYRLGASDVIVAPDVRDEFVEQPAAGVHGDHGGEAEADQRQRLCAGAAAQVDGRPVVFGPRQAEFREERDLPGGDLVDVAAQHPDVVLGGSRS